MEQGDPQAAERLLPLVYDELRRLATQRLAHESPGQTLQSTALVHEAYIRLVDTSRIQRWESRGHFFAAAAEAMRRILIDAARRKLALKRGDGRQREELQEGQLAKAPPGDDILALNEALDRLADADLEASQLVKLRFFAGLTSEQAAEALGISVRTAERTWAYARSFLFKELEEGQA
jgi:RNA polymerase sigma factor (TIGR02999 family)